MMNRAVSIESGQRTPGFLFLIPWELQQPGGVTQVVINLFNQACFDGAYQPMLLIPRWEVLEPFEIEVENRLTIYYRLRGPWHPVHPVRNLLAFVVTLPGSLKTTLDLLRKHGIEVINAHYPSLNLATFVLLRWAGLFKGKVILSFHGKDLATASQTSGMERFLWRALLQLCDAITTCSESLKQQVVAFAPGCKQKVHAIHNGLDMQTWLAEREQGFRLPPELEGKRFVLNVATFEHKKGQDVLIKAFEKVAPQFPDLLLVLIGGFRDMKESLARQALQAGLADRVLFFNLMPHAEVVPFLEHATLFVLPSRIEPFGIVLLEAGAMNVPVIASRVGGIPEVISDGESGLLVPPENPLELSAKIVELIENSERRKSLATSLNKRVIERFTWKRAYHEYLRIIG